MLGLEDLPDDILLLILDRLKIEEIVALSSVSTKLYALTNHQDYWLHKSRIHFPHALECMNVLDKLGRFKGCALDHKQFFVEHYKIEYKPLTNKKRDLFFSIKEGNIEKLLTLNLEKKDLLLKDEHALTPLDWARKNKHRPVLDFFFQFIKNSFKGDVVSQFDELGYYLFHWAVLCDQLKTVKVLAAVKNTSLNKTTPLHLAARSGQLEIVKAIIAKDRSTINEKDGDGNTALSWAITKKQKEVAKLLIIQGADLKVRVSYSFLFLSRLSSIKVQALHLAARLGQLEIVKAIIAQDPSTIDEKDGDGNTALCLAIKEGQKEIAKLLIIQGADLKVRVSYSFLFLSRLSSIKVQALHLAARLGQLEIVKAIIAQDPSTIDEKDGDGNTALSWAITKKQKEIAKLLIIQGANLKVSCGGDKNQVLHLAVRSGQLEIVKAIIAQDPSTIDEKDGDGNTALSWAITKKQKEIAKLLIIQGADLKVRVSYSFLFLSRLSSIKVQALHLAARLGQLEIVEAIIAKVPSTIDEKDGDGNTALCLAIKEGQKEIAKLLIIQGADLKVRVSYSFSFLSRFSSIKFQALHLAARLGQLEIVKAIIAQDPSTIDEKDGDGNTALSWAITKKQKEVAKLLIIQGANLKVSCGGDKNQALHLAVRSGQLEIVNAIIAQDPSTINEEDGLGNTPLLLSTRFHCFSDGPIFWCSDSEYDYRIDIDKIIFEDNKIFHLLLKEGAAQTEKNKAIDLNQNEFVVIKDLYGLLAERNLGYPSNYWIDNKFIKFLKQEVRKVFQIGNAHLSFKEKYEELKLIFDKYDKLKDFNESLYRIQRYSEASFCPFKKKKIKALVVKLEECAKNYMIDFSSNAHETFKGNCILAVNEIKPMFEEELEFLLTNLILAILGAVVIYGLACCVNKAVNGHYLFFRHHVIEESDSLIKNISKVKQ